MTPFRMVYGTQAVVPLEFAVPSLRMAEQYDMDFNVVLKKRLDDLQKLDKLRLRALLEQQIVQQKRKYWHDSKTKVREFKQGNLVLLYQSKLGPKKPNLKITWSEPYEVDWVFSNGTVRLKDLSGMILPGVYNGAKIKLYHSPTNDTGTDSRILANDSDSEKPSATPSPLLSSSAPLSTASSQVSSSTASSSSSPYTFTILASKPAPASTVTIVKKTITAHEGSSSRKETRKEPKVKVAIKPPTPQEYSNEEAELLQRWGFQLTPAIIEHIFNVPNAPVPEPCTGEQISKYLNENPEEKEEESWWPGNHKKMLGMLLAREFKPEAPINLVQFFISSVASQTNKYPHMQLYKAGYVWRYIYQVTSADNPPPPRPLAITLAGEPEDAEGSSGAGKRLLEGPVELPGPKRPELLIKPPVPPESQLHYVEDQLMKAKQFCNDTEFQLLQAQQAKVMMQEQNQLLGRKLESRQNQLDLKEEQLKRAWRHKELIEQSNMSKYLLQTLQDISNPQGNIILKIADVQQWMNKVRTNLEDKAETFTQALVNEAVVSYLRDLDNKSDDENDEDEDKDEEDNEDPTGTSGNQGPDDDNTDDADLPGTCPSGGTSIDPPPPPTSQTDPPASTGTDFDHPHNTGAVGGKSEFHCFIDIQKAQCCNGSL
ncbi:hypothetical protein L7F22_003957 [Adiantum nelumboides]|nr:hypothetical protein [Adiantum nelumboides]